MTSKELTREELIVALGNADSEIYDLTIENGNLQDQINDLEGQIEDYEPLVENAFTLATRHKEGRFFDFLTKNGISELKASQFLQEVREYVLGHD